MDLDEIVIQTISGFSIEQADGGYLAVFTVAFFGPDLEASYPDVKLIIDDAVWPEDQIAELHKTRLLGELHAVQIPPRVRGNDTDMPKWVVTTHGGSQAERIAWRKSIG